MKKLIVVFLTAFFALFGYNDAELFSFGGGINDFLRHNWTGEFRLEYKSHLDFLRFRPLLGFLMTMKKATYLYGGVGLDLYPVQHFVFSPNFAVGYYNKGDGKDLGYPLEFRTGIEIALRFNNLARLGMNVYHVSNARLGNKNPGMECIDLFLAWPIYYPKGCSKRIINR